MAVNTPCPTESSCFYSNEPAFFANETPVVVEDVIYEDGRVSALEYPSGTVSRIEMNSFVVQASVDTENQLITFHTTHKDSGVTDVEIVDYSNYSEASLFDSRDTCSLEPLSPASAVQLITTYKSPFWHYNWYFYYTDESRWLYCRPLGSDTTYTTNTRAYPSKSLANDADDFYDQVKVADNCLSSLISAAFQPLFSTGDAKVDAILSIIYEHGSAAVSDEESAQILAVIKNVGAAAWGSNVTGAICNAALCATARYNARNSFQDVYKSITGKTIKI